MLLIIRVISRSIFFFINSQVYEFKQSFHWFPFFYRTKHVLWIFWRPAKSFQIPNTALESNLFMTMWPWWIFSPSQVIVVRCYCRRVIETSWIPPNTFQPKHFAAFRIVRDVRRVKYSPAKAFCQRPRRQRPTRGRQTRTSGYDFRRHTTPTASCRFLREV